MEGHLQNLQKLFCYKIFTYDTMLVDLKDFSKWSSLIISSKETWSRNSLSNRSLNNSSKRDSNKLKKTLFLYLLELLGISIGHLCDSYTNWAKFCVYAELWALGYAKYQIGILKLCNNTQSLLLCTLTRVPLTRKSIPS